MKRNVCARPPASLAVAADGHPSAAEGVSAMPPPAPPPAVADGGRIRIGAGFGLNLASIR